MSPRVGTYAETWRSPELADPRYSLSLARGLAILECFAAGPALLGINDIAGRLGMSPPTTHRYVMTLLALGYVERGPERKYRLGLRVTELGMSALNAMALHEHASPMLQELSVQSGLPTSLAVLDGPEIVYLARADCGPHALQGEHRAPLRRTRLPAFCTAAGKVLLAHAPEPECRELLSPGTLERRGPNAIVSKNKLRADLRRVRKDGLALEDEECTEGVIAIATPVLSQYGEPMAAIELVTDIEEMDVEQLAKTLREPLTAVAARISARLGYRV